VKTCLKRTGRAFSNILNSRRRSISKGLHLTFKHPSFPSNSCRAFKCRGNRDGVLFDESPDWLIYKNGWCYLKLRWFRKWAPLPLQPFLSCFGNRLGFGHLFQYLYWPFLFLQWFLGWLWFPLPRLLHPSPLNKKNVKLLHLKNLTSNREYLLALKLLRYLIINSK